ncbi:hypothetical protein BVX95_00535 [archaeon D22]|nr:hypothetical protein BVX95_00535 [archaeon D22]
MLMIVLSISFAFAKNASSPYKINKNTKFDLDISSNDDSINVKFKGTEKVHKFKRLKLKEKNNVKFSTPGVFIESDSFLSAEIVLQKTGPINSIYYCSDEVFASDCLTGWEKTEIPFVDNGTHILFNVSHFSTYAGGYVENISSNHEFDNVNSTSPYSLLKNVAGVEFVENTSLVTNLGDLGAFSAPGLADLDNDGDLDMIAADSNGVVYGFRNNFSTGESWVSDSDLITGIPDLGTQAQIAFADLDNDGDYDFISAERDANWYGYRNNGSVSSPSWELDNTLITGISGGSFTRIALGDLDGDGDYDAIKGDLDGVLYGYRNNGTVSVPSFESHSAFVTGISDVGANSKPALFDIDGDGDLDFISGTDNTFVKAYKNDGNSSAPVWTAHTTWETGISHLGGTPALGDIDGDGQIDILIGGQNGLFEGYSQGADVPYYAQGNITSYSISDSNNQTVLFDTITFDGTFGSEIEPVSGKTVLLYHFNNESVYGETDSLVNDFSASNRDGTCSGATCPVWSASNGKLGGGFEFDGVDDYISVPTVSQISLSGTHSVGFWFKANSGTPWSIPFASIKANNDRFSVMISGTTIRAAHYNGAYTDRIMGNYVVGEWTHWMTTFDGATLRGYVNGVEVFGEGDAYTSSSVGTIIGKKSDAGPFNGSIDELVIYNYALNTTEVETIYNQTVKNGTVKYQVETSNNDTWTGSFVGPDGTTNTYYTSSGQALVVDPANFLKYKFYLEGDSLSSPTIANISVKYNYPVSTNESDANINVSSDTTQLRIWDNNEENNTNYKIRFYANYTNFTSAYSIPGKAELVKDEHTLLLYHFDNDSLYGESDNMIYDFAYGNNITSLTATWDASGLLGGAYYFDGANDYMRISNHARYDKENITISFWAKMEADAVANPSLFMHEPFGQSWNFFIESDDKIMFRLTDETPLYVNAKDPDIVSRNVWTHIAGTYVNNVSRLYVNGVEVANATSSVGGYQSLSGDLFIGNSGNNLSDYTGYIDEVAIFNYSLSPAEINNLYSKGLGATCLFSENSSGTWSSPITMTYDSNEELYFIDVDISSAGNYKVSCNGTGLGYDYLEAIEEIDAPVGGFLDFCDSGDLETTCNITSQKNISVDDFYIEGSNINVLSGGSIVSVPGNNSFTINLTGDLYMQKGSSINLTSGTLTLIVDAFNFSGKIKTQNGIVNITFNDHFFNGSEIDTLDPEWTKYNNTALGISDTTSTDGRIPLGNSGKGDSLHIIDPSVIKDDDGTYKMWYSGYYNSRYKIYLATSPDGLTWTKYDNSDPGFSSWTGTNGRIPAGNSGGGDYSGALYPSVIKDDDGTYKMWYTGYYSGRYRIYYATSPDGLTWSKYDNTNPSGTSNGASSMGRVFLGSSTTGDDYHVYAPHVLKDDDGTYKMWYSGHDQFNARIYYATSPDGVTWTKYDNSIPSDSNTNGTNGRIPLGLDGSGDNHSVFNPTVIKTKDGTYKMWYSGYNGSNYMNFYATSPNGLTWTKFNNENIPSTDTTSANSGLGIGNSGQGDSLHADSPTVVDEGDYYSMWYRGGDSAKNRIYYARGFENGDIIFNIPNFNESSSTLVQNGASHSTLPKIPDALNCSLNYGGNIQGVACNLQGTYSVDTLSLGGGAKINMTGDLLLVSNDTIVGNASFITNGYELNITTENLTVTGTFIGSGNMELTDTLNISGSFEFVNNNTLLIPNNVITGNINGGGSSILNFTSNLTIPPNVTIEVGSLYASNIKNNGTVKAKTIVKSYNDFDNYNSIEVVVDGGIIEAKNMNIKNGSDVQSYPATNDFIINVTQNLTIGSTAYLKTEASRVELGGITLEADNIFSYGDISSTAGCSEYRCHYVQKNSNAGDITLIAHDEIALYGTSSSRAYCSGYNCNSVSSLISGNINLSGQTITIQGNIDTSSYCSGDYCQNSNLAKNHGGDVSINAKKLNITGNLTSKSYCVGGNCAKDSATNGADYGFIAGDIIISSNETYIDSEINSEAYCENPSNMAFDCGSRSNAAANLGRIESGLIKITSNYTNIYDSRLVSTALTKTNIKAAGDASDIVIISKEFNFSVDAVFNATGTVVDGGVNISKDYCSLANANFYPSPVFSFINPCGISAQFDFNQTKYYEGEGFQLNGSVEFNDGFKAAGHSFNLSVDGVFNQTVVLDSLGFFNITIPAFVDVESLGVHNMTADINISWISGAVNESTEYFDYWALTVLNYSKTGQVFDSKGRVNITGYYNRTDFSVNNSIPGVFVINLSNIDDSNISVNKTCVGLGNCTLEFTFKTGGDVYDLPGGNYTVTILAYNNTGYTDNSSVSFTQYFEEASAGSVLESFDYQIDDYSASSFYMINYTVNVTNDNRAQMFGVNTSLVETSAGKLNSIEKIVSSCDNLSIYGDCSETYTLNVTDGLAPGAGPQIRIELSYTENNGSVTTKSNNQNIVVAKNLRLDLTTNTILLNSSIGSSNAYYINLTNNGNIDFTGVSFASDFPSWITYSSLSISGSDSEWDGTNKYNAHYLYDTTHLVVNISVTNFTAANYSGMINVTGVNGVDSIVEFINVTINVDPKINKSESLLYFDQSLSNEAIKNITISSVGNAPLTNVSVSVVGNISSWLSFQSQDFASDMWSIISEGSSYVLGAVINLGNFLTNFWDGLVTITNVENQTTSFNISLNVTPIMDVVSLINLSSSHDNYSTGTFRINSTGNVKLVNVSLNFVPDTLPFSWIELNTTFIDEVIEQKYEEIMVNISVPKNTSPGEYHASYTIDSYNVPVDTLHVYLTVTSDGSWYFSPTVNQSKEFSLGQQGGIANLTIVNDGNIPSFVPSEPTSIARLIFTQVKPSTLSA